MANYKWRLARPGFRACALGRRTENWPLFMEQNVVELPVADRLWTWFDANRKQLILGAVAVLAVGSVLGIYFWRQHAVQEAASDALSAVEAQLAIPGGARNESAEAYVKVANEHAGTGAAARALLQGGAVFFAQAKYADAQTQFQRFLREYGDSQYRSQALLGNAACLDALGKADEAAAAYQALTQQQAGSVVAPQAKFAEIETPAGSTATWTLRAMMTGTVTFGVEYFGEIYCGWWNWHYEHGTASPVMVEGYPVGLPLVARGRSSWCRVMLRAPHPRWSRAATAACPSVRTGRGWRGSPRRLALSPISTCMSRAVQRWWSGTVRWP